MLSPIRYSVTLPPISIGNRCDRIKTYFIIRVAFLYVMLNCHTGWTVSSYIMCFVNNISHGYNLYIY